MADVIRVDETLGPKEALVWGLKLEKLMGRLEEGGPGSGFHGHKGIPDHRGGSLPRGSAKGSSEIDPDAVDRTMDQELGRYSKPYTPSYDLSGKAIGPRTFNRMRGNALNHLDSLDDALTPTTRPHMEKFIGDYLGAVKRAYSNGELKEIDAGLLDETLRRNIDKLVYQEIETRRRQLGDHGIRHVTGNIDRTFEILDELGGHSGMDYLIAAQTMVDHDMGYTSEPAKKSYESARQHAEFSGKYVKAREDDYRPIFGDRTSEFMEAVESHADSDLDWKNQPLLSAIRTSDNLSLFSQDKLPALFMEVPGATTELLRLQLDRESLPGVKKRLNKLVRESDLDSRIKEELTSAIEETSPLAPKFVLGMLSGEVDGFNWDGSVMGVSLKSKPERDALTGLFDLGDRQFTKFIDSYNTEGSPASGISLIEKDSGQRVLKLTYTEGTTTNPDLLEFSKVSVRPQIRTIGRILGLNPTPAEIGRLRRIYGPKIAQKLTSEETTVFWDYLGQGKLDSFPITARELGFLGTLSEGGPGSGNWNHEGRPGFVGGSRTLSSRIKAVRAAKQFKPGKSYQLTGQISSEAIEDCNRVLSLLPEPLLDKIKGVNLVAGKGDVRSTEAGYVFTEGGNFNLDTGILTIYEANDLDRRGFEYIIGHESGHAFFNEWINKAAEEAPSLDVINQYLEKDGMPKTNMVGYPQEYVHALTLESFTRSWITGGDGITDYSKVWYEAGEVSETVAEMTRLFVESRSSTGSFDDSVADLYMLMPDSDAGNIMAMSYLAAWDSITGMGVLDWKEMAESPAQPTKKELTFDADWSPVPPEEATYVKQLVWDKKGRVKESTFGYMEGKIAEGGPGSGNFGHEGRPGEVGGSTKKSSFALIKDFKRDQFNWKEDRGKVALDAYDHGNGFVLVEGGEPVGIVAYSEWSKKTLVVNYLATKRRGYGRRMMREVFTRAKAKGFGVFLVSRDTAAGFYEKIGMHKISPTGISFHAGFDDLDSLIKSLAEGELEDLEPEDGVFVVSGTLEEGGPGSGFLGHAGRKGKRGGSKKSGTFSTTLEDFIKKDQLPPGDEIPPRRGEYDNYVKVVRADDGTIYLADDVKYGQSYVDYLNARGIPLSRVKDSGYIRRDTGEFEPNSESDVGVLGDYGRGVKRLEYRKELYKAARAGEKIPEKTLNQFPGLARQIDEGLELEAKAPPEMFRTFSEKELAWNPQRDPHVKIVPRDYEMVTGRPITEDDAPEYVYHATTQWSAIKDSGKLKGMQSASKDSGGLGGGVYEGVSTTKNPQDAALISRELRRMIKLSRVTSYDEGVTMLKNFAESDVNHGADGKKMSGVLDHALESAEINPRDGNYTSGFFDAYRNYLSGRERAGGDKNPIIYGRPESFRGLDLDDVKVIRIPRRNLFTSGSAVLDHAAPSDFLEEIRVFGDVPVWDTELMEEDLTELYVLAEALEWRPRLRELTKFQRALFERYRYGDKDEQIIFNYLLEQRVEAFEREITRLLALVGCTGKGVLTNDDLYAILVGESKRDSVSIVNTFNYELIGEILRESAAGPKTRKDWAGILQEWERGRAAYKGSQIATWTVNKSRSMAQREFFERNRSNLSHHGRARVVGQKPAVCMLCNGWLNRGWVPLEELLKNPPPYHQNCKHAPELDVPKVKFWQRRSTCNDLWIGE